MKNAIIEIHPKSAKLDPMAKHVQFELEEDGESPKTSAVSTCRLFKIEGDLQPADLEKIADTLLVDRVVEKSKLVLEDTSAKKNGKAKKKPKEGPGFILDVWPKHGVTDPVGETVEKGIRDLGFRGAIKASSAARYFFPKMTDKNRVRSIAKRLLSNELIHDIDIRKTSELN